MGDELNMTKIKSHSLKTIREEFNEYELEDGTLLRAKQVIVSFALTDDESQVDDKGGKFVKILSNFHLVSGVVPTGEFIPQEEEFKETTVTEEDIIKEMKFENKKSFLNIYETDEFLLFVRTIVTNVYLAKQKDRFGQPRYRVSSQLVLEPRQKSIIAPPEKSE